MIARIWRRLRGTRQSPARVALAVALGLFIGCVPVYGAHVLLCALVCLPFGLDFVLAYLLANVSNPLLAPFLITLEVEVGSLLLEGHHAGFTLERARHTGLLGYVWQATVGSVFVGAGLAALGAGVAYVVARRQQALPRAASEEDDPLQAAVERTLARYRAARRSDRFQVAGKLYWDPLTKLLAALPRDLGRVLDAGAGRGQFGLLLLELGACQSVRGFDSDTSKVRVAELAARGAAHFEQRDLLDLPAQGIDTLLLFDVLHYLPLEEQDELLRRAARLVTRGRILIRELNAGDGARSRLTRLGEWIADRVGLHRGRAGRHYRPASELLAQLESAGFSCTVLGASAGTPFANVLIVAERSSGTA